MLKLRALCFKFCFYGLTIIFLPLFLPTLLLPAASARKFYRAWCQTVLFLLKILCGIKIKVTGRQHLPQSGTSYIIASAHQSALETLLYNLLFPDCCFVLKQELVKIPIFGWYLQKAGNIQVDRDAGTKALRHMQEASKIALDKGHPIIIFPQGTRVAYGDKAPVLPGVSALYGVGDAPLYPVSLNTGKFWPKRGLNFSAGEVEIKIHPAIKPDLKRREMMAHLQNCFDENQVQH